MSLRRSTSVRSYEIDGAMNLMEKLNLTEAINLVEAINSDGCDEIGEAMKPVYL